MQRWVKKAVLRVFLCNCISIWYVILCKIKQIHVTQHVFCTMDHIFYYIFVQGQKRLWFASLATNVEICLRQFNIYFNDNFLQIVWLLASKPRPLHALDNTKSVTYVSHLGYLSFDRNSSNYYWSCA